MSEQNVSKRPERKYRMIRVSAGDYLLPSNDLKTLWRIYKYREDGSAKWGPDEHGKYHDITGEFWACARYERPFDGKLDMVEDFDFLDWGDHWLHWDGMARSRQEAIDAALKTSEREASRV